MYKLLCSNITKSHRSLTNFTGYYRKVAQKCNRSASTSKKLLPEAEATKQALEDGTDPVECPEEALDSETPTEKKPRSYSSFFSKIANLDSRDLMATSVSPSRFFHCSTSDNKSNTYGFSRHFKDKDAEKYYQQAIEQCMDIKSSLDKIHPQSNWAVRPAYPSFRVRREFEHIETKHVKEKPKTLKTIEKERLVTIPELERIAAMQTKKPKSQFKESNMRITYPTHIARYKVVNDGTKLQHAVKLVVAKHDQKKTICKDPFPEPFKISKTKSEASTEVDRATMLNLRSKQYQRRLKKKCWEGACEYTKQQMKFEMGTIQQHPTVRKANPTVRMAFKNKYNKLLKKSSLLYQAPNTRNDIDVAQVKDQTEHWEQKPPKVAKPPQTYEEYEERRSRKKDKREPQISEHPISIARQPKVDPALKYPKRIMSEKSENYDIDATCIKDNHQSNVTRTYGDFIAESEDKVKSFVQTHKLEEKELLEEHVDMKKQAEVSPEPESQAVKEGTPIEGINEYLKKLKDLRDQTAVDKISIKRTEPAKSQATPKTEDEEVEAAVKKSDGTLDKQMIPTKLEQVDKTLKVEEKAEPMPETFLEKEAPKTKQYPISDKFVAKKDEDPLIRKTANVVKDTTIRKNRPKTTKVRSQSVDNTNQETRPVNRTIALKTIRSDDLTKKVLSIRATPKVKPQQPTIRPALAQTRIEKMKPKPRKPSLEKLEDRKPSKEVNKVDTVTMKKIMEQYQVPVKVEFRMSMAEMKRINRRKRREREKRLKAEAKMQEKKLQEEALMEMKQEEALREQERKHRYRLEDLVTAVKEVLKGKEEIVVEESKEETVVKPQDSAEVVLDAAPKEKQEVVLKKDVEKVESKDLIVSGIGEKATCTTAETKVVNYFRKPDEIAPTDSEINENLINKIVKSVEQEVKPSAEGNLLKPKEIKDKADEMVNEGVYAVKKGAESNAVGKKEKQLKYLRNIIIATPKDNLEKATEKAEQLHEKNIQLHEAQIGLEPTKNQPKLKAKKAKIKAQVLGKRKDLPLTREASEELATTSTKHKEQHVKTDAEKARNKELEEMRKRMKEYLEKQSREVKPKNILDAALKDVLAPNAPKANLEKTTKCMKEQAQSTTENTVEGSNDLKENKLLPPKKELEGSDRKDVKDNLDNQIKPCQEVKNKPVTEKDVHLSKDPEKMSIKEIEEEEKELLKKINSLRVVKGKYLLSANLTKDGSPESEKAKKDITKVQKGKVEVPKEVAKSSGEKKEQIERHKLEEDLEKHEDIVKVVNEKYLLEANLKQASNTVKEEAITENVGTIKEALPVPVPEKTDSTTAKKKEVGISKKDKDETPKEKPSNTLLVKAKENNLKESVIEEQKEKESLQTSVAFQYPKDAMNKSLSIKLEDKEIQILIKNVEKASIKAQDERIVVHQDMSGIINLKNVQEEIKNRVPNLKVKRFTSLSLDRQIPIEKMEKIEKKDENIAKPAPQKERAVKDIKKAPVKTTEAKGLRRLEKNPDKPISEIIPVHKPIKLKSASSDRKTLPEKIVQEKTTEKRKQSVEKYPKMENVLSRFSKLQQENVAKLKEASKKIVKPVKKMNLVPDNQPTIRRDPPPKSREKKKKDHPKSKTDIVLPPKGRNDPKTASKTIPFEDPRRNFVEEINKVLSKATHSPLPKEEVKKCKSLADVAGEQKAKILKEIEVTWNKENNKTKEKNLPSNPDSKECQRVKAMSPNKAGNFKNYYDEMKDLAEKRKLNISNTTFCMNTIESTKDKVSKLPIKVIPKCQRDKQSSNRIEVLKKPDEVNDGPKKLSIKSNKPVSNYNTTHQEGSPKEAILPKEEKSDVVVFKGSIGKPQLDKGEGISVLHLKKMKRARIEDDFLKRSVRNVNLKDSWHNQDDSDFSFTKLKRARIENDHVAYETKEESSKTSLIATKQKWRSRQDATLYLQNLRRGKIEDDAEAKLEDWVGKKRPVKSASESEIGVKIVSKNSKVKSDVEKLIHVMKKADKELEEVLKVYEILKIPKPQHRNLMKMESRSSRKQEKLESRLKGSTDLVPVKKVKKALAVKDSKTYTVGTKKSSSKTNKMGRIKEVKSHVSHKKPKVESKEDTGKECKAEEKSTEKKDKPHKYLLTAGLQNEVKKQLKGRKEEVKCNASENNEAGVKIRKQAKICHKDDKETDKSRKAKAIEDKSKKKKSMLFPGVKKTAIKSVGKPEGICDKPTDDKSAGDKTKDFSDNKLSVQLLPNDIDVLVNKIVAIRSQDTPVAKPKETEKHAETKEKQQEKPREIPGKRKTNLRTEDQHVSIATDTPHTKPSKNIESRTVDGSMVERRMSSMEDDDVREGYNENNLSESSATQEKKLKNTKSTADFPIERSNLIDMFIKSKKGRNRKDKNVRTIFMTRRGARGTNHRNKSFLKGKSKLVKPSNKKIHLEHKRKPSEKKKKVVTPKTKKDESIKYSAGAGKLSGEEEKIIKFAQNVLENIMLTKHLLEQQLEFLEGVASPAKPVFGDNRDKLLEGAKLPRIVNLKQSGETYQDCGTLRKSEKAVTLSEKISEIQAVRGSVQDLKTKFEEFFTTETNREGTKSVRVSKGNTKIDRGDCKKAGPGQNLKKLEAFEENALVTVQNKERKQVEMSNKKVRHVLSMVNDGNVNLEGRMGVDEEIKTLEKENKNEDIIVGVKENAKKLRKVQVLDSPYTNVLMVNDGNGNLKRHVGVAKEIKTIEKKNADEEIIVGVKEDPKKFKKDEVLDDSPKTNVDLKKMEIGRQSLNHGCNMMERKSRHDFEKDIDGSKLKEINENRNIVKENKKLEDKNKLNNDKTWLKAQEFSSDKTVQSCDENQRLGKECLQIKTKSSENRNVVEENKKLEDKNKRNNDKTSLKVQESSGEICNVDLMTNFKLVLAEDNDKPKTAKSRKANRAKSNVEIRPIAPFYQTKENSPKEKKLTSTTEPSLNKFTNNKPEEKSKYKYTTQKIKHSLIRPTNNTDNTKGNGKRDWETHSENSKTSLHSRKKQKTSAEATDSTCKTSNYKYTNQNLKQNLMKRNGRTTEIDTVNESKKRVRDESLSKKTLHTRKRQKTDFKTTASKEQVKSKETEDKRDEQDTAYLLTGAKPKNAAPRNSDSDICFTSEQLTAEESLKKVFSYYVSNKDYFQSKYAKDKSESTSKESIPPAKKGKIFRKRSILNRVKKNALPTVPEVPLENCQSEEEIREEDEGKLVIPKYFIKSEDNIHNALLSPHGLTEELIQKLSSERRSGEDCKARNGTMKAHIEQIFKKYYKEDEKIYKFNKHLIRYLRQPGEKAPHSFHKQQLNLSLEPRHLEENQVHGMLYKLITNEFKKSEDSTGFTIFKNCKSWEGIVCYSKNKEDTLPKLSPRRSATFYIEKTPRNRYTKEDNPAPVKPVARSCERLCLPLKTISQAALRPSVEEMTTLNKFHSEKVQVAPKVPDALEKYKDLKITYINISRPKGRQSEGFLPRIIKMDKDAEEKVLEKMSDPQRLKRQILEFRYELLRKLHKEFSALYDKDVNRNQGKFDKVSKYYKSVMESVKNKESKGIVVIQESKSIVKLFEPSAKPSFERVVRYYNLVMEKDKGKRNEVEGSGVKALVEKLPAEGDVIDKSRNNCKEAERILTKSMEKKAMEDKDPEDPKKES